MPLFRPLCTLTKDSPPILISLLIFLHSFFLQHSPTSTVFSINYFRVKPFLFFDMYIHSPHRLCLFRRSRRPCAVRSAAQGFSLRQSFCALCDPSAAVFWHSKGPVPEMGTGPLWDRLTLVQCRQGISPAPWPERPQQQPYPPACGARSP